MTNNEEVFETLHAQATAVMERWYKGDPFGWLDNMADEATYMSPFEKHRIDGKGALVDLIAPAEGQIHSPGFDIVDPDLHLGEDMAVFTYHLSELDENGALSYAWKVTEAYRLVGSEWKMIHAHFTPNMGDE